MVEAVATIPEDIRKYVEAAITNSTGNRDLERLASEYPAGSILNNQFARLRLECTRAVTGSGAVPKNLPPGKTCDAVLMISAEKTANSAIAKKENILDPTHLLSLYYVRALGRNLTNDTTALQNGQQQAKAAAYKVAEDTAKVAFGNTEPRPQVCSGATKETCKPRAPGQQLTNSELLLTAGNAYDAGFVQGTFHYFASGKEHYVAGAVTHGAEYAGVCREALPTVTPRDCNLGGHSLVIRSVPQIIARLPKQR